MTGTAQPSGNAPHQALYRRWRAQTFSQIVGQEAVVETLRNAVRAGRVSHATLFVGPRGTGKTSLARILAKALNCTNLQDGDPCDACEACVAIRQGTTLDVLEIDAASNRGIQDVKDLRDAINYVPSQLRRKVYILDEAHQITKDAWNALLKSLEEPPEFVAFMFASTHPQDFPPAILSRLQRYDVRRLTVAEIEGKLRRILEAETIEADPAAVHLIARLAAGGMRDAETMLDQLLASGGGRIDEARVRDLLGLADADAIERLLRALIDGDPPAGIAVLEELDERGRDIGVVLDQLVDAVRVELSAAMASSDADRVAELAGVARRLSAIDPTRIGVGGVRLQLELVLFSPTRPATVDRPAPTAAPPVAVTTAAPEPREEPGLPVEQPPRVEPTSPPEPEATAEPEAPPEPAASTEPAHDPTAGQVPAKPGAAAATAGATPAAPDLDRLVTSWDEIVSSVGPATRAVITECRPMSVEGNAVILGFPEAKGFLKDIAERKRPDLETAIGGFLGRAVSVRCVATNLDLVPPAPTDEEAAYVLSEARKIFADDLVDVGEVN